MNLSLTVLMRQGLLTLFLVAFTSLSYGLDLSLQMDIQGQFFPSKPKYDEQEQIYTSFTIKPEAYWEWNDGDDSLTITPFRRVDAQDRDRSHFDLREFLWIHVSDNWESRIGITKVFWGITESQHLVDIVNQTDFVESPDGEEKLGQPMIGFTFPQDWGLIEVYALLGFRERTFPGQQGRFRVGRDEFNDEFIIQQAILRDPRIIEENIFIKNRPFVTVNTDLANNKAMYESDAEEARVDFAIRWSHSFGDLDTAISYFNGTSREPEVATVSKGNINLGARAVELQISLHPYYRQMQQVGIELQYLIGDWTLKWESVYRDTGIQHYTALTAGFEYTLFGVFESDTDVGILMEQHYDQRGKFDADRITSETLAVKADGTTITTSAVTGALQLDTFIGGRITMNDVQSTQFLGGIIYDNEYGSMSAFVEFSRRMNDNLVLSVEGRGFFNVDEKDVQSVIAQDDLLQIEGQFYF